MASGRSSPLLQSDNKDKALIILSSHAGPSATIAPGGVSATSFIESYVNLSSTSLQIVLASPTGSPPVFTFEDEKTQTWIKSKVNLLAGIKSIADLRETDFSVVVVPHCLGGLQDLSQADSSCAKFLTTFLTLNRPICTIGFGAVALLGTTKSISKSTGKKNGLFGRCVTAPSNAEVSRFEYFKNLSIQMEDSLREVGAKYTCAEIDSTHVVIDGNLVTAQNVQSSSLALYNVIWLWKAGQNARKPDY